MEGHYGGDRCYQARMSHFHLLLGHRKLVSSYSQQESKIYDLHQLSQYDGDGRRDDHRGGPRDDHHELRDGHLSGGRRGRVLQLLQNFS